MSDGFITSHIGISGTTNIGDAEYTFCSISDGSNAKYKGFRITFRDRGDYYLFPFCTSATFDDVSPYVHWQRVIGPDVENNHGSVRIINRAVEGFYGDAMKCVVRTLSNGTAQIDVIYDVDQFSTSLRRSFSIIVMYYGLVPEITPLAKYINISGTWIHS